MPVSIFTYVYLIFMIASFLCSILAACRRKSTHLEILIPLFLMTAIGFIANLTAVQERL